MKHLYKLFLLTILFGGLIVACSDDDNGGTNPLPDPEPLDAQVRVQVAYDASTVAFRFVWVSQSKTFPVGFANTGKVYPGQFHDMLKHNGTKFDRLPSGQRIEEDRVTFMIDKHDGGIAGNQTASCAIACHTGMARHNLLTDNLLDHWHWRGGRSGPMGYAEDAAVNNVERIRDNVGTPPSKFIRSGGDRFRENQPVMTGTSHPVLVDGFPRFVFNKGKKMPNNFTIPGYFLADESGKIITDPYAEIPTVIDASKNRSLLVVHQDKTFDPIDKVNAIDLGYLVYVATSSTGHLPAHLQDNTTGEFNYWVTYWAAETGIKADETTKAGNKLNEIHQEWVNSNKNAMVTHSVGFIYNSDQHDISSTQSFDSRTNQWTVVMYRRLATGSQFDCDLSGLPAGAKYTLGVAMHDLGAAAITHNYTMPITLSNANGTHIVAKSVGNVQNVNWKDIPNYDTYYVKQSLYDNWTEDWLRSSAHPGASGFETMSCEGCHQNKLIYNTILR